MHILVRLFALLAGVMVIFTSTSGEATEPVRIAAVPPMGWNSWNFFADKVSEADIRAAADALVNSGMRDAGYVYVNIDDGWQGERDAQGVIHPNARFPDMRALADYLHERGLKLGLYSSPGSHTCAGFAGSLGHEEQDAKSYAAWGVDYLKYDLCSFTEDVMEKQAPQDQEAQMRLMVQAYEKMHQALLATGRPIVYSLCQYGLDAAWEWAASPAVGANLWRTTYDIRPNWDRIYTIASQQAGLARYAGPGHWNDPDMLEVGNGQLTSAENRAHFSWWAMLAAPLLAGNDLAHMPEGVRSILTHKAVIDIDQDPLGHQAVRSYVDGEVEVWTRPLAGGALAVGVFNVGNQRLGTHPFHLDLARIGLHGTQSALDLWSGENIALSNSYPVLLATHDVLLLRIDHPY